MSVIPPPTPDEISVSIRDIGLGVLIGSASWLIRYFCSTEKQSLGYIFRRTATAGFTALCVGMATKGYLSNDSLAFAAAGMAGYASPELVDYALLKLRKGK